MKIHKIEPIYLNDYHQAKPRQLMRYRRKEVKTINEYCKEHNYSPIAIDKNGEDTPQ